MPGAELKETNKLTFFFFFLRLIYFFEREREGRAEGEKNLIRCRAEHRA